MIAQNLGSSLGDTGLRPTATAIPVGIAALLPISLDSTVRLWEQVRSVRVVERMVGKDEVLATLGRGSEARVLVCGLSLWASVRESAGLTIPNPPDWPAVVVAGPDSVGGARQALQLGVRAYVPASRGFADLVTAVEAAAAGYSLYPQWVVERVALNLNDALGALARGPALALNASELKVVGLIAAGLSDREIASAVNLSVRTVEARVSGILAKVGVSSRLQLAVLVWAGDFPVPVPSFESGPWRAA